MPQITQHKSLYMHCFADHSPKLMKMRAINMAVFVLALFLMAQHSLQQSVNDLPVIGLVLSTARNERALINSGRFKPNAAEPYVDIAGRRFHQGTVGDNLVVYVVADEHVNAAITTQILVLRFRVRGIVHFGTAGSIDDSSLNVGDVAVYKSVGFTDLWSWKNGTSGNGLNFGDFNYPDNGVNSLGSVTLNKVTVYSEKKQESVYWLLVDSFYYDYAKSNLKDLPFTRCAAPVCLTTEPKLVSVLKGSSSGSYISNSAYGDFLRSNYGASTVDTVSAHVALTSVSNGRPFIVFRGISNSVREGTVESTKNQASSIASYNAMIAATEFIRLLPSPRLAMAWEK
ncbi:hypothetical protein Tsubulata_010708 [Turnera subulata]|uniref:Nucleoside phosphorylase domain-containing protein n=1 Tax=Turnera subulata TaxID=218843 RepID=A0A9Q0GHY3_9ROSI|nr:hypothetical protein Tsubulata_010708 [Turnera subulata]